LSTANPHRNVGHFHAFPTYLEAKVILKSLADHLILTKDGTGLINFGQSLGSSRPARRAGARVNILGHPAMVRAAQQPGKTIDRYASGRAGDACGLWYSGPENSNGSIPRSTGVVAVGEMGDKTQLLAFLLAAKFKRPVPIILGVLVATLVNHLAAGALGAWIAQALGPLVLRWVIGLGFLAMAGWMLIPDKVDANAAESTSRFGVFGTTVITFFLAEMGDKTQIATVALAARYGSLLQVVAGTTLGMMLADIPAVFLGDTIAKKVNMRLVRGVSAFIFALLGVLTLLNVGKLF
jgi:putative Ca2+/H+ antiporter (TMEM165/GDT1 family)